MGLGAVAAFGLLAAAGLALVAEIALRIAGFHRFPLFAHHAAGGFRMRANQVGRFRNRIDWSYDAQGMRVPSGVAGPAGAMLLVGDSVVEGGLRIAQSETLTARLARCGGPPAYPLACHAWALANELAALEQLPDWQTARTLILLLNTSDMDQVGQATNELSFPMRRPRLLLVWLVRRQLFRGGIYPRPRPSAGPYPDHALREQNLARLSALCAGFTGQVFVFAYPYRGENPADEPHFAELAGAAGAELVDVKASAHWSDACYADDLHPNARGVRALAAIICERCC